MPFVMCEAKGMPFVVCEAKGISFVVCCDGLAHQMPFVEAQNMFLSREAILWDTQECSGHEEVCVLCQEAYCIYVLWYLEMLSSSSSWSSPYLQRFVVRKGPGS